MRLGYNSTGWTVALLADHLRQKYGSPIKVRTLRRRMHELGLRWKRPRYTYATKDPHRAQKKGGLSGGRRMQGDAVLLIVDATILRWFPPLRYA